MKSSTPKRSGLKPSTRNQALGKMRETAGKVQKKVGKATRNPNMEDEGVVDGMVGKVQKKVGQVQKVFGR